MHTTTIDPKQDAEARPDRPPVVLRAEGLSVAFGGHEVLKGVDLSLHKGEVVLLRGENGSGKTTLLNILTGNLEPDAGSIHYSADDSQRSYRFPRKWWQNLNPWDHFRPEFVAREGFGRTWQDIRLFSSQTLRENITTASPCNTGENPAFALLGGKKLAQHEQQLARKADSTLKRFGLESRENSSADRVSLGQSKRVAIARAIAAGAEVLLLDEPLAGLDGPGIRDVLAYLEELVREKHLTLVIVEHVFNHPHLHGLVTSEWLLDEGRLSKKSKLESPDFDTHSNQQSAHISHRSPRPAWFSLLAGDNAEIIDEALPRGATLTRIRRLDRWSPEAPPILEIKDLIVRRGQRTVLGLDEQGKETGFNLTIYEGEIVLLQAPNGWGKSTLFDALSGEIQISPLYNRSKYTQESCRRRNSGSIRLEAKDLNTLPVWRRVNQGLQMLPSTNFAFDSLSIEEAYRLAKNNHCNGKSTIEFSRKNSSLSGGQAKRLALEKLVNTTTKKKLSVMDEPFSALDSEQTKKIVFTFLNQDHTTTVVFEPCHT